jgi:hypothetical protein
MKYSVLKKEMTTRLLEGENDIGGTGIQARIHLTQLTLDLLYPSIKVDKYLLGKNLINEISVSILPSQPSCFIVI